MNILRVSILTEDSDRSNSKPITVMLRTNTKKSQSSLRIPIVLTHGDRDSVDGPVLVSILTEDSDRSNAIFLPE